MTRVSHYFSKGVEARVEGMILDSRKLLYYRNLAPDETTAILEDLGLLCICYAQSCGFRRAEVINRNFWIRNRYVRIYATMLAANIDRNRKRQRSRINLIESIARLIRGRLQTDYRYDKRAVGRPPLDLLHEHIAKRLLVS